MGFPLSSQDNALFAMVAPGRPSPERAAVALLRLVSFPTAIALLVGGWGPEDYFYTKWSEALSSGLGAVFRLCLESLAETACIALIMAPVSLACGTAMRVQDDITRLHELSDRKLEDDGIPRVDPAACTSIVDVGRAIQMIEVRFFDERTLLGFLPL